MGWSGMLWTLVFRMRPTLQGGGGPLLCQVSSHSDQKFSFHRANIHTHRPTSRHGDRNIRAALYYVVDTDNNQKTATVGNVFND